MDNWEASQQYSYRLCEEEWDLRGLAGEELWCFQGHGPTAGLFNAQHGFQRRELLKLFLVNFVAFFSVLNCVSPCFSCSQLEVLHLLSPVQKAELLMRPEVASLDNATLTLIFHNLLTGGSNPKPTAFPGGGHNWTSPLYPPTTHNPQLPLSTRNGLREVLFLI